MRYKSLPWPLNSLLAAVFAASELSCGAVSCLCFRWCHLVISSCFLPLPRFLFLPLYDVSGRRYLLPPARTWHKAVQSYNKPVLRFF